MATKKAGGTASQKTATIPKNLGVKMHGGELAFPGQILVRQRGTKYHPGDNVGMGKDHTLFSTRVGFVRFSDEPAVLSNGKVKDRKTVVVVPLPSCGAEEEAEMVRRRAAIKREMLRGKVFEPALYMPLRLSGRPSNASLGGPISLGGSTAGLGGPVEQSQQQEKVAKTQ